MQFLGMGRASGTLRRYFHALAMVAAVCALPVLSRQASAEPIAAVLDKANVYIEAAKTTERAVDSFERYQSWVNMKTGPTGKERYISYGLYDVPKPDDLQKEVRAAIAAKPAVAKLDALMVSYLDAYVALVPVVNRASAYYDNQRYEADKAVEGQALHKQLVPLFKTFMASRDAMMPELRLFVRDVEGQELAAIEARDGRKAAWHVGNVLHTANRVFDVFPRIRPQPIGSDEMDRMMESLGPNTSGEKFDQIIAGVKPPEEVRIDVKRYGAELDAYAKAVSTLDSFSGEEPDDFDDFKRYPAQLLEVLRALQEPIVKEGGRQSAEAGQLFSRAVQVYFSMFNEGNGLVGSQLRYLP